ncbi:MAG: hypothetical protein V1900_04310 [Candidatus Aenigmatarchaeota archaeon]
MILYLILAALIVAVFVYIVVTKKPKTEEKWAADYILDDANFERDSIWGTVRDPRVEKWQYSDRAGWSLVAFPREMQIMLNPTMPPGGTAALEYALVFQLGKWEWKVAKADEWVQVSPAHKAYYDITLRQKEELEGKVKTGLASAAQAVADLELLKHDQRKYREFLEYFGLEYDSNKKDFVEAKDKKNEHAMRALFIDMVDVHTGEGISMRSIVSRWPTLIVDFQKLGDDDTDVDKIKEKQDVSRAEAVVLVTKNKLYTQWKRMFEPEVRTRYKRIDELVKSREKSLVEYREWLKPYIARHKMLEDALSRSDLRGFFKTFHIAPAGQAMSVARTVLWCWRDMKVVEFKKGGTERLAIQIGEKTIDPYDEWTKKNLIFHKGHGLITKYPWITDEWVKTQKKRIIDRGGWIVYPERLYYSFIIITITRMNIRLADGGEFEDAIFHVNACLMSENVMLTKLLELKAKQEELNRYVDGLIGIGPGDLSVEQIEGQKKWQKEGKLDKYLEYGADFFSYLSMPLQFMKHGPYERDMRDRITKYWLASMAKYRYGPVVNFIKTKMGVGT